MNTFVLLPYFLLIRVSTDTNTWRYGPEYTYSVDVHMTNPTGGIFLYNKAFNVSTTLKCRPQGSDSLNCRLNDIKTAMLEDGEISKILEGSISMRYDKPFQVKFDNRGIRDLVVNRDITRWSLDMIRGVVAQLNIGIDMLNKSDAFNDTERSFIGECKSYVNISRERRDYEPVSKENFEIVSTAWFKKAHGETVQIEKIRDMENCLYKKEILLPGTNKGFNVQVKQSVSNIIISDTDYESYTEHEVAMRVGKETIWLVNEKIDLNLVSVLPAEEPLPPISDPTTVSFFVYNDKK